MNAELLEFCPRCGTHLVDRSIEGRNRRYCETCDSPIYQNPKPVAGAIVVDGEEILLVKRGVAPAINFWSLPAGYLEVDEPPKKAAVRELKEETNLVASPGNLELHSTQFIHHNEGDPHVLVIIYTISSKDVNGSLSAGSDVLDAGFFSIECLREGKIRVEPGYSSTFRDIIGDN